MKTKHLLQVCSLLSLTFLMSRPEGVQSLEFKYHNAEELQDFLNTTAQNYPDITHLYSIGKSINGIDLWVIAIGESPRDHVLLRPNIKYVGNMHGNEVVGREELLHFVDYLVTNYGQLDNVTSLLNTSTVHILPSMNPDGFAVATTAEGGTHCTGGVGRGNANNVDLNRNFPDFLRPGSEQKPIQPETQAIIDWIHSTQFVLSANLHGGAVCVSYPFDTYLGRSNAAKHSPTPDDDVYVHLATLYADAHAFMTIPESCPRYNFTGGITNGAGWYPLHGGMQDYHYFQTGTLEVTLEVSCCKFPNESELQYHWEADREPLLLYLMQINRGVRGIVRDQNGKPVEGAVVSIQGRELISSKTTSHGEYWKLLLPGHYRLLVSSDGCHPEVIDFEVEEEKVTILNVTLELEIEDEKFKYHNAEELESWLRNITEKYPDISYMYSIGKSVRGTDLWVIAIGERPREHVLLRPNVKYVANMHGNEVVGREEMLHFAEYLAENYKKLDNVTKLLETALVHIMPSMNPDGFVAGVADPDCVYGSGRNNANGYNLNRNFPDFFREMPDPIQPETQAVMDWIQETQFVLSANLHGGAVCVNYPFDTYLGNSTEARPHHTPDHDVFLHLSNTYAQAHPFMTIWGNCPAYNFTDGITNGAEWYPVTGGMQDYNYLYAGCLEVTLEVSCCKFPPASELKFFWDADRDPLLLYLMQINMGVRGVVKDEAGNPLEGAIVSVQSRELITTKTTKHGEYWRLLMPGHYRLLVSRDGCEPKIVPFEVKDGIVARVDVTLASAPAAEPQDGGAASNTSGLVAVILVTLVTKFWCASE